MSVNARTYGSMGQKVIYKPVSEIVKTLLQERAAEVTVHKSGEKTLDASRGQPVPAGPRVASLPKNRPVLLTMGLTVGPDYGAQGGKYVLLLELFLLGWLVRSTFC